MLQTCNRQKLAACASCIIKMNAAMVYTTSIVEFGTKMLLNLLDMLLQRWCTPPEREEGRVVIYQERRRETEGGIGVEGYDRGGVHHQRETERDGGRDRGEGV